MQQLKIRKFGPLKEVELQIQDYMVFIGPQASGKSTILKIIYIFKSLREEVFRTVADIVEGFNADPLPEVILREHIVNKFKSFWDNPERYGDFFLQYDYGNEKLVSIFQKKKLLQVVFSEKLEQEIRDIFAGLRTFISDRYKDATHEFKESYYQELDGYIYELFDRERIPVYIPAGRVMVYGIFGRYLNERLDNTMKIFIQQIAEMRPLYFEQLEKMVNQETAFNILDRESVEMAIALIKQILKGDYAYGKDDERIKLDKKGTYIEMPVASTGQQESLWLMMQLFTTMLSGVEYLIIIDEPEAHLYPLAQKQLIALITLVANYTNNQVVMTTNSPTVLKTINNQVYAGRKKGDNVEKVMNCKFWLEENKLGAYLVENGGVSNIIEDENGMIAPNVVDVAGGIIDEELKLLEG